MGTASLIKQSYELLSQQDTDDTRIKKLIAEVKGGDLQTPLQYYINKLKATNVVFFKYMKREDQEHLLKELQVTFLLLSAQKKLELDRQKTEKQKKYQKYIDKCKMCIAALEIQLGHKTPEQAYINEARTAKYLGIPLAQWFSEQIVAVMDRKTKTIKENLGWFNEKRLYWVWGSSLLKTVLSQIPEDFFHTKQASAIASTPDVYMGYLSWTMYYFRFSLNLCLLLKHTIGGPWMSEEEKNIPWTERFVTQWEQRKFTLLNDSLWATCNMVSFFWLNAKQGLGPWGDLFTMALLVFDISLAIWDFEEQKTSYNKEILDYQTQIDQLKTKISQLQKQQHASEEEQAQNQKLLRQYEMTLRSLKAAKQTCERDWEFQKISLYNNFSYAVGLLGAFALLTLPFLPVAAPTAVIIGTIGAVLCFTLTVIHSSVKGGMEVYKAGESLKEAKQALLDKIDLFKALPNTPENENEKKFLYLEILDLQAETKYQHQLRSYQTMHLVRSIMFEALVPAIIFASLVFLPMGWGFGIIGATIGLAIATNLIINSLKPKKEKVSELNPEEFEAFAKNPKIPSTETPQKLGLFQPEPERGDAEVEDSLLKQARQ